MAIDALPGLTDSAVSTGPVTDNAAEPLMVPDVAVIIAVPCTIVVANPPLPTVATDGAEDVHVDVLDRFCVVPLLYVPVAVNCSV